MNDQGRKQPDEAKLLKRARALEKEALAWIYQDYHDAIFRYIYHHLGNAQTSEDLAADVFRRFLQALHNGGGPNRRLSAWLYRVAHNLVVDELRRQQHRDHASLDDTLGDVLQDDIEGVDSLVGHALNAERLRKALFALTDDQRQVIVLKFLEGLSNAEVAEITGKTIGAVKALQHRGLGVLRAQLVPSQAATPASVRGELVLVPATQG